MVLYVCAPSGRLDCQLSVTFWPEIMYVTLHGISGNKVNAHTRHVITRSHANGLTYLPWRYAHKNNRFGKGVRSHSSYLANTLSSFVSLTDQLILYNPAHFVSCVCQLLNCENGICEVYYSQNIVENKDLLSDPKVVILKETFMANHGSFLQDFHKEFNQDDEFHKVQRSSVWRHELLFKTQLLS